ncbi:CDGSH iron-sulfur domain-containing protein [Halosquirtibacter xylanolyticus]|uniref:CDGSH iron-sulfur domain-containing protein n=1 Tax=Halosquirtibacter xylanolyticus TaxID=3374599 RepID=UPI00374A35CB|nr:CDGSH iron-sulfur domain-containing protein [Prolixibacteraceae bacterium]
MKFSVEVAKNGPYLVKGKVKLTPIEIRCDEEGNSIGWNEGESKIVDDPALCRCGRSKNAPYCDGSHIQSEFNGHETASFSSYLSRYDEIDGPKFILTDVSKFCSFARFCDTYGSVWKLVEELDDPEGLKIPIDQVKNCPSGRLVLWDSESKERVSEDFDFEIAYIEDQKYQCSGPLRVTNAESIRSLDKDMEYEKRPKFTLCRCGESSNKPFCDGTHASMKFQAVYKNK